jgi:hypothetical protein
MTENEYASIANNTGRIAEGIAKHFPHLKFAVWDLSDFMPYFHNVRRTMKFVECEKVAREEMRAYILGEKNFGNLVVFDGKRRPKNINEEWIVGRGDAWDVVVIVARDNFNETNPMEKKSKVFSENVFVPVLERRIVDVLSYSFREWLPIPIDEAAEAFSQIIKFETVNYGLLSRYATRRYLGWFLNMLLFKLCEKKFIERSKVDGKLLKKGERAWNAIKKVEKL